jgi:hypothetical protein
VATAGGAEEGEGGEGEAACLRRATTTIRASSGWRFSRLAATWYFWFKISRERRVGFR